MDGDPWCWGTEQIISHLCHSTETWSRRPNCSRPDPVKLETILREQRLDGATLLEDVDKDVLKNELGLHLLAERSAVLWAIDQLRSSSDSYRASLTGRVRPDAPKTEPEEAFLHPRFGDDSFSNWGGPMTSHKSVDTHSPIDAQPQQLEVQSDRRTIKQERLTPFQSAFSNRNFNERTIESSTPSEGSFQRQLGACFNLLNPVPPLTPIQSPKRQIGKVIEIVSSETNHAQEEAKDVACSPLVEPPHAEQARKKRRVEPLLLQPLVTGSIEKSQEDRPNAYLNRAKIPIDSLFYNEYQHGEVMDCDSDDQRNCFSFQTLGSSNQIPPGLALFTHRRIKHYFSHPPMEVNASKLVSYPYPDHLTLAKDKRSATTFTHSGNEVTVRKIDASLLGSAVEGVIFEQQNNGDDSWDYLLARYPTNNDDDALPLYEESGSENNYDESLLDEMEYEQSLIQAHGTRSKTMSQEEVSRTIDAMIEGFRESWQGKNALSCQAKAWSVWRIARGRNGARVVSQNQQQLEHLDSRLAKLKNEMTRDSWTTSKSLQDQCRSLEETVNSQEELKWRLHLWQSRQEPKRVLKVKAQTSMKPKHHIADEDSESVGSESDSLGGFIDVDESADEASGPASFTVIESGLSNQPTTQRAPEQEVEYATMPDYLLPEQRDESMANSTVDNEEVESIRSVPSHKGTHRENSQPSMLPDYGISNNQKAATETDLSLATENDIGNWDWTLLDKQRDQKRIVVKLLHSMSSDLRQRVEKQIFEHKRHRNQLKEKVQRTITALVDKRSEISGISVSAWPAFFSIARLWVCWNEENHRYYEDEISEPTLRLACKAKDFPAFFEFISSRVAVANESDSDGAEGDARIAHSKRKKKVIKSQQGAALQKLAQQRLAEFEARVQKLEQQQKFDLLPHKDKIVVNVMKHDDEGLIFLNPFIASRIKSHQIEGLRFLWREIVSVSISAMQGCLLAHTMGLGKTMQAISLLVTVTEAAGNPKTINQIPENLRRPQFLILCPPGLVENWKDELKAWVPPELKTILKVFKVVSGDSVSSRVSTILEWNSKGGILLLGYFLFRSLADPASYDNKDVGVNAEALNKASQSLLQATNIVVLDEAHTIKNRESKLAAIVSKFSTQSRIGMTGSPLCNNIGNYFSMVDLVAPGYLGDCLEFNAFYKEPIEDGMYADVPKSWIRTSMKKSQALKRDIEPKVHRASATVLANHLKPKIEFVLMLQLTEWQRNAYLAFLESTKNGTNYAAMQTRLFDAVGFLSLLCAHPAIFLEHLQRRQNPATSDETSSMGIGKRSEAKKQVKQTKRSKTSFNEDDENSLIEDDPEEKMEVSDHFIQRQQELVPVSGSDQFTAEFSAKMIIVQDIILQAKRLGEQVLLFSRRLGVLEYSAKMMNNLSESIEYFILTGETPQTKREMMVKAFNSGSRDVFLISTLAGGLGLNITSANRVILVDFSFNPMNEEQAVGRAYRIGQTKPVYVYHLVTAGTFEATLHNATIFKKQLASNLVDKKNLKRAASKENIYLANPKDDVSQSDLEAFRGKDEILDYVLNGRAGNLIREIKTADTTQAESDELLEEDELKEVETMRTAYHELTGTSSIKKDGKRISGEERNRE